MKYKPRKIVRWSAIGAGLLLLTLALPVTAFAHPLAPGGQNAQEILDLFKIVLWIAVAIFVLVEGMLLFAVFRYRRRSPDEMPEQVHGNNALEIIWTIIPGLILVGVAMLTFRTLQSQSDIPTNVMTIEVTGQQWVWNFHYPDNGVTVQTNFKVPADQPVLLRINSIDVVHSFWMPDLGGKVDAVPGRETIMWFVVDEPGTFVGQCAEFCGLQHYLMLAEVDVVEHDAYDAWIAERQAADEAGGMLVGTDLEKALPTESNPDAGEALFGQLGCAACHSLDGSIIVGPSLQGIGERAAVRRDGYTAEEYIRESVQVPCEFLADDFSCVMPQTFGDVLTEQDMANLIAFLMEQ